MYGEAGGNTPALIWHRFMEPALQNVKNRDWFEPKGTPAWIPGWDSGAWAKNPSFDTTVGGDPSAKPRAATTDAAKDEAADAADDKAAGEEAAADPATGGAADPATGGGQTPAPVTPAPTPVTPAPVTPTPAPVAKR